MAAPLRRVFSKHVHAFLHLSNNQIAMTSVLPFCARWSKQAISCSASNRRWNQALCRTIFDVRSRSVSINTGFCPVFNNKLSYRNKCYHEHLLNNYIKSQIDLQVYRTLASCWSPTFILIRGRCLNNSSVHQRVQGEKLQNDVLCRYLQNSSEKKSEETLVSSQKENIYTIPNLLTLSRMVSAPFLGYMVMNESFIYALGLFAFAGVSDLLDGYIARNFKNQNSILGSALDPMADKILISVLTLTLTAVNLIPLPLTALIVGRDVGLVAASFYLRYISLTPPKTLSRYFDVTLVSAKLEPFMISKWNTAFQLSLVALTLAAPVFNYIDHPFLQGLWYLTGATTFISGVQYVIYWKDSVKILRPGSKQ